MTSGCAGGVDRPTRHRLRLRARDEDSRSDTQFEVAKARPAGQVLQGHPLGSLLDESGVPVTEGLIGR